MPEIRKPAIKIEQGKRSLFLTSFSVRDFMRDNFYRVDRLDVTGSTGMQRLLNTSRARRFSKDIVDADICNEAFLPTSVFLATSGSIGYDEEKAELFFESAEHAGICPLDVVDGQHRIEGLKMAAKENDKLLDFPISVIIAHNLTEADKMLQFVTVNTKQQAVSDGVAQHIIARFTKMMEVEKLPYLPEWLKKEAEKGSDAKALDIVRYLNSEASSPWNGRIILADEPRKPQHTVNQASFVKSIKKNILSKNHPLNHFEYDKQKAILRNYWIAIRKIFVEPSDDAISNSVVFKYTGMEFFHIISTPIINYLARDRSYTEEAIKKCILSTENYLTPDVADMMSPDFWKTGSGASGLNASSAGKRAASFAEALAKAINDDIQV